MSEYSDSAAASVDGAAANVRRYQANFFGKEDKYDVHYVQFTVPHGTTDLRLYYDEVVTSVHSDFWTATEVHFEVDNGTHEVLYRASKESNEHRESAHFHFDRDGYGSYYNGHRVRFIVRHGNERADSALAFWVDQYG